MKLISSISIFIFLTLSSAHLCFATEQFLDALCINGQVHYVEGFMLSKAAHDRLIEYRKQKKVTIITANWDGFYAKLSLVDKKLIIDSLEFDISKKHCSVSSAWDYITFW